MFIAFLEDEFLMCVEKGSVRARGKTVWKIGELTRGLAEELAEQQEGATEREKE
jgi:hypothetical protein